MEPPRRRRPPARRPPAPPAPAPDPVDAPVERAGMRGVGPFRLISTVGAVVMLAVIGVAAATGNADQLPWGAILGVAVILVAMVMTSRRRERRMREAFPDDDD